MIRQRVSCDPMASVALGSVKLGRLLIFCLGTYLLLQERSDSVHRANDDAVCLGCHRGEAV